MLKPALFFLAAIAYGQSIPTANFDANRTNANTAETILTPTNVTALHKFGLTCTIPVDDRVFAQPLYIPHVQTSLGVFRNMAYVVTMNDSAYGIDVDACSVVWSNLAFDTPYSGYPVKEGGLYGNLGCLSTPVADASNLYAVCDGATGPTWKARAFSLNSGSILYSASISGQVTGTGDTGASGGDSSPGPSDTTSGANVVFYPQYEFQRAGLALSPDGSKLYVGFGGLNDSRPYHGWLFSLNTSDLSQAAIWCSTPNSWGGGLWLGGGAPAIDAFGNVYVTTGNGYKAGDAGAIANSVVKLSSTLGTVTPWFPSDEAADDGDDADVAADRFLLIPGTSLGISASKDFNVYLIDTSTMTLAQSAFLTNSGGTPSSTSGAYGMSFANNILHVPTTAGSIYAFTFGGSTFTTMPLATQTNTYGFPGPAQIAESSNGGSSGILWAVTVATGTHTVLHPGTLRALNPSTLSEYWNSDTSGIDTLGSMTKFVSVAIAGGHVMAATQDSKIQVYGLTAPVPSSVISGATKIQGAAVSH